MINLSVPRDNEIYYTTINGSLVGPLSLSGPVERDSISWNSGVDKLRPGSKNHGENNVDHLKISGNLNVFPAYRDLVLTPSLSYPYSAKLSVKDRNGYAATLTSYYGPVGSPSYQYQILSSQGTHRHIVVSGGSYDFTVFQLDATVGNAGMYNINVAKSRYSFKSGTVRTIIYNAQSYVRTSNPTEKSKDFLTPLSAGEITSIVDVYCTTPSPTIGTMSGTAYTAKSAASLSITQAKSLVDSIALELKYRMDYFPLIDEHYGTLAMKASEKVNRNSVNMIAFLRDLRNPKQMIPKLKKLTELRTHASNHLAIQYGVLPTISDLKTIFDAFKKIKPYIDKNGFNTYNAVSKQASSQGSYSFELQNRIKIAIGDDDSTFSALAAKVDSMGFALTLENTWDLIPYSFVVDWFIDIGGFLERADGRMRLMRQDIRYATMSRKRIISSQMIASSQSSVSGTISAVQYQRWTTDHSPVPPLTSSDTPNPTSHWLEGGALIVQRAKLK